MNLGCRPAGAAEAARNAVGAVFRPAKDEHRVVIHALEQFEHQIGFLRIGNGINDVFDRLRRCAARPDFHRLRMAHRPADQRVNLGRNGG